MLRACKYSQDELLEVNTKEQTDVAVMTTKYNPSNLNIKNFIHQNWNIIQNSNDCIDTFSHKPIIGFKRLPNLIDMLTNATISYPPKEIVTKKLIPNHCIRLGKCTYCPIIKKIDNITCNITGKTYNTVNLPNKLSCELNDIVYLITCTKCNEYYVGETGGVFRARMYEHKLTVQKPKDSRIIPVSKHFTGNDHSVRNMQFTIL